MPKYQFKQTIKYGGAYHTAGAMVPIDDAAVGDAILERVGGVRLGAAEPSQSNETRRPDGDALTLAIINAIGELDSESDDDWTADGAPAVAALERVLGYSVSAAERDTAWAEIEPEDDNGEGEPS